MATAVDPVKIDILEKPVFDSVQSPGETIATYFIIKVKTPSGDDKFGKEGKTIEGRLIAKQKGPRYVVSEAQVKELLRPSLAYLVFGDITFSAHWNAAAIKAFGILTQANAHQDPGDNRLQIVVQSKKTIKIGINKHTNNVKQTINVIKHNFKKND